MNMIVLINTRLLRVPAIVKDSENSIKFQYMYKPFAQRNPVISYAWFQKWDTVVDAGPILKQRVVNGEHSPMELINKYMQMKNYNTVRFSQFSTYFGQLSQCWVNVGPPSTT